MLGALLYLRLTSLGNWLRARLLRLRQPKYLFGAIVGTAYIYFFFVRPFEPPPVTALPGAPATLPTDWLPLATAIGAIALLFFATCMWVVPTERAALGFNEAEIAFLFPAPITRRGLVHFRLLSAQLRSLVGAALMMLFSQRWTFLGGNALTHALGWWFIFSGLNLHLTGARFVLTRLADRGLGVWRRRLLVLALVTAVVAITLPSAPAFAPNTTAASPADMDFRPFTGWLVRLADTAPLSWLLWPFTLVLGPFLAPDASAFFLALAPALAVIVLHYLWVVQTALAFEDASVEQAQKRAARVAAWRAGGQRINTSPTAARRAPFPLAPVGWPELAFLWKNLLSTWPYFTWRIFLGAAAVLTIGCLWLRTQPGIGGLLVSFSPLVAIFAAYTLLVGPQFARQDIRSDLANADLLKTYPLAGWQIILGQLLTPIAILTGILWLALLALALTLPDSASLPWLTPAVRISAVLGLACATPFLAALQLLVPNAAALFFPSWFHATRHRGGGPEVIGQRMIFFFAQLVTMIAALAPAVLVGASAFLLQIFLGPALAIMLAASAILVVLAAEVAAGVWLIGRRFEALDLSAELRS